MSKCLSCNKNEKVGYKYCEPCKKIVAMATNKEACRTRRASSLHKCEMCYIVKTSKTHCKSCSQIKSAEYRKVCQHCNIAYSRTKYCKTCAPLVKALKANEKRRIGYVRPTKRLGSTIPTGDIDKKWLVRGNVSLVNSSSAFD